MVDPTFATRDLVRALHRTPRYVVLVLAAQEAKLFESQGDVLLPARRARFPRSYHLLSTAGHQRDNVSFLREVDKALGA